jgi:hypothetical protein
VHVGAPAPPCRSSSRASRTTARPARAVALAGQHAHQPAVGGDPVDPAQAGSRAATRRRAAPTRPGRRRARPPPRRPRPSTPLARSSALSARRARPRPAWREVTQARAKAASSIRPTSPNRSRTASATSSGSRAWPAGRASCWRVLGAPVSARRQIERATCSGSPGSSSRCGPPAGGRRPDRRVRGRAGAPPASTRGSRALPGVGPAGHRQKSGCRPPGRVQLRADAELLLDLLLDLVGEVGVVAQEVRAFSLPWPSWSPSYVYQAPDLRMKPCSTPSRSGRPRG